MFPEYFVSKCVILSLLSGTCVLQINRRQEKIRLCMVSSQGTHETEQPPGKGDASPAHSLLAATGKFSITASWLSIICKWARLLRFRAVIATVPALLHRTSSERRNPFPSEPLPSSHLASSAAAASSASKSRNVSSAGSYTSLKAPRPTCPWNGVAKLCPAIVLHCVPCACACACACPQAQA